MKKVLSFFGSILAVCFFALCSPVMASAVLAAHDAPDLIEYSVKSGDTLSAIAQRFCSDYVQIARENGIVDLNRIYADKTVLRFKNGCLGNAPSVLVKQSASPRELVSNGGASSGKHISSLASRDTEAQSLPQTSVQPAQTASAPQPTAKVAVVAVDPSKALDKIYHKQIYRIASLKRAKITGKLSRTEANEMHRLQAEIQQAILGRFSFKNAGCLFDGRLSKSDRLVCIRENYGEKIAEEVRRYPHIPGLTQSYVEAVMLVESGGRPDAISETGCSGVKQFTMGSAKKFKLADRLDPYESIRAGVDHLASNLVLSRGNISKATAHYNAGSVEVYTPGFNASAFPYTQAVLWAQRLIERTLPPVAGVLAAMPRVSESSHSALVR